MKKFWFLAPACVLLFSLQVLAAPRRADSRTTKTKDDDATWPLVAANPRVLAPSENASARRELAPGSGVDLLLGGEWIRAELTWINRPGAMRSGRRCLTV